MPVRAKHIKIILIYALLTGSALLINTSVSAQSNNKGRAIYITVGSTYGGVDNAALQLVGKTAGRAVGVNTVDILHVLIMS
ncbi:hypothetical protein EBAPG3_009185 [Nitrosospira lacus]|uniref:Uncharacterized protein n=1 Tax=Nitrosospira lacus TaxID=1288494 RepID=A0A1W6SQ54_9PROT|nr:hypothetical protein [Nitrosospira lacus]ARO87927.1 hypothetical protein EBAPG3_009185 [Nitrosospira lacus]